MRVIQGEPEFDPIFAIEWAIEHEEDHFDRLNFLQAWREGRFDEWKDYVAWAREKAPAELPRPEYGAPWTVGKFGRYLVSLNEEEQTRAVWGAYFVEMAGERMARTRALCISWERVDGNFVRSFKDEANPKTMVIWTARDERAAPAELPEALPGHWETAEGLKMAQDYATKSRADLAFGDRSDLSLANDVYMADRNSLDLLALQTAAKERIRWLSVQLALAAQDPSTTPAK